MKKPIKGGKGPRKTTRAPRKSHVLTGPQRMEATLVALRLFGRLMSDVEVAVHIAKEYGMSSASAKALTENAYRLVWEYAAESKTLAQKVAAAKLQATELTRMLLEEKSAAAVAALKYLHQLEGINPTKLGDRPPTTATEDEFTSRSAEENEFFAEHGCWPEEWREPAKHKPPDPLAKLH